MSKFGPFELDRCLGRGGMGEVFLATRRDDPARSQIVVKRLRPEVAQEDEYLKRLVFEAQVAARLSHPNLVRLLEFGKVGDCHYLAMEHVSGFSLRRLIDDVIASDNPAPPGVALSIASGVLAGLSAMHRARDEDGRPRPILHRDITPQNVIVTHQGKPVLIDFGIAKDVMGPAITQIGRVLGTAPYMSPEHRTGGLTDPRADVFSASVIFWELLTARAPWPRLDTAREILRTVFDPPELNADVSARIPPDLLPILLQGLECDANARFADAHEMLQVLSSTQSYPELVAAQADRPWAETQAWLERLALAPDESLKTMVVDTRAMVIPADELVWSSSGELAAENLPDPILTGDLPGARILTIPPLPPRREAAIATAELNAVSDYETELVKRRRWISVAGFVLVAILGLTVGFYAKGWIVGH